MVIALSAEYYFIFFVGDEKCPLPIGWGFTESFLGISLIKGVIIAPGGVNNIDVFRSAVFQPRMSAAELIFAAYFVQIFQ